MSAQFIIIIIINFYLKEKVGIDKKFKPLVEKNLREIHLIEAGFRLIYLLYGAYSIYEPDYKANITNLLINILDLERYSEYANPIFDA